MGRHVAVAMAALLAWGGCGFHQGDCSGGAFRCIDNNLEVCVADGMFGPTHWNASQSCVSPQVCRVNPAGPDASLGAPNDPGCFDPDAYCTAGSARCYGSGSDSTLWACVLRASDRTFRWTRTACGGQVPPTTCVDYFVGLGSANAGCYDVVWNCTVSDPPRCEGNVLLVCSNYPALIDGKAVFEWDRFDCSQNGQVCRTPPGYGPGCWPAG